MLILGVYMVLCLALYLPDYKGAGLTEYYGFGIFETIIGVIGILGYGAIAATLSVIGIGKVLE
jgi:hypothetical protein